MSNHSFSTLTHEFPWNARCHQTELLDVYLTDFGHGVFHFPAVIDGHCYHCLCSWPALKVNTAPPALEISPYALRAPEVIVGAKFDTQIDIWALGCIVSMISKARHISLIPDVVSVSLTGHWLFEPEGCEEWSRE
jgi:serine/threonine protein kinase